jgi:hypothetical protein
MGSGGELISDKSDGGSRIGSGSRISDTRIGDCRIESPSMGGKTGGGNRITKIKPARNEMLAPIAM